MVGDIVGLADGGMVGSDVGDIVGECEGAWVGVTVGVADGLFVGEFVGDIVGAIVGAIVGVSVGVMLGLWVGPVVGLDEGLIVGKPEGDIVGECVGGVGDMVGLNVGADVQMSDTHALLAESQSQQSTASHCLLVADNAHTTHAPKPHPHVACAWHCNRGRSKQMDGDCVGDSVGA